MDEDATISSNMRISFIQAVLPLPVAERGEDVFLHEPKGNHTRIETLAAMMDQKSLEPKDLVQYAMAMYAKGTTLKVPEGFRARFIENCLNSGPGGTANKALFEFAEIVANAHPGKAPAMQSAGGPASKPKTRGFGMAA